VKRKHLIPLFLVVILSFALTTSSLAAERRASDQINRYSIAVTPVSNSLQVTFSVYSYSLADKIGCESIEVYEKSGSRWSLTESLDENDAGMSTSNSRKYVNTIYCDSEPGVEYKVVVTIFAENSAGRDTRTQTKYVTGA